MFLDTQPAALAASGGIDPYAEFRVSNPRDVASLLKQLAGDATPVVLSGPDAAGLTTVIWTVDSVQQRVNFSADADSPQLQRLIELEEATCVAYLDSVKLQFDVDHLVEHFEELGKEVGERFEKEFSKDFEQKFEKEFKEFEKSFDDWKPKGVIKPKN